GRKPSLVLVALAFDPVCLLGSTYRAPVPSGFVDFPLGSLSRGSVLLPPWVLFCLLPHSRCPTSLARPPRGKGQRGDQQTGAEDPCYQQCAYASLVHCPFSLLVAGATWRTPFLCA